MFNGFRIAILLLIVPPAAAQTVSRAYVEGDRVHVVHRDGSEKLVAPREKQTFAEVAIAADNRTVGWEVLVENCCTSYRIPTGLLIYKDGGRRMIHVDLMIHEWRFVGSGDRVAILSGPVHGWAVSAKLYRTSNGKVLAEWNGKDYAPDWAAEWADKFAPGRR